MIRNQKLKNFLINTLFRIFSFINQFTRHDTSKILLYSNLEFRDNTKALYDYLIENKYYNKYKIICCTNDYKKFSKEKYPNVSFKGNSFGIFEYFRCNYVYYSFGKIPIKPHKNQKVIQMWHGTPFKAPGTTMIKSAKSKTIFYTHAFAASEMFKPIMCDWFLCPLDIIYVNGHPRTDIFFKRNDKYDFGSYNKLILWAPTFRKSIKLGYSDVENAPLVPILKNEELQFIDNYLKEKNIKIIIKLHPLQDLSKYNFVNMTNLILMSHNDFINNDLDLYLLAAQSDALITDYSSIFYDFLLLNRPIAFTEDDISTFEDRRGFSVSDPEKFRPGFRIKTSDDLLSFINDMSLDKDDYKVQRTSINNLVNKFQDGYNSKRALELAGIYL